jgi:hypothetical protein
MNRKWVLQNLRETVEHIESVIAETEQGNDLALEAFIVSIYRDLNRAWNGRNCRSVRNASGDVRLCEFPTDIDVAD